MFRYKLNLVLVLVISFFVTTSAFAAITFNSPTTLFSGQGPKGIGSALGTDGFLRIAYRDYDLQKLFYIVCNDADCSDPTITEVADDTSQDDDPGSYILALGSDGFGRMVYMDTDGNIQFVQCLDTNCTTKNINPITTGNDSSDGNYGVILVMGDDNLPRIEYEEDDDSSIVHFIRCTNASCSAFNDNEVAENGGYTYDRVGLDIGSDGYARILYGDIDIGNLYLIRCTDDDCTTPVTTSVIDGETYGYYDYGKSIKIGSDGFPRIAWVSSDSPNSLYYIVCNDADCTSPTITLLSNTDNKSYANNIGMGLRTGDLASISYGDTSSYVHVLNCTNANCTSYDDVTIDTSLAGSIIGGAPVTIDSSNAPILVYSDYATGLYYARGSNPSPSPDPEPESTPVHHSSGQRSVPSSSLNIPNALFITSPSFTPEEKEVFINSIKSNLVSLIQQLISLLQIELSKQY